MVVDAVAVVFELVVAVGAGVGEAVVEDEDEEFVLSRGDITCFSFISCWFTWGEGKWRWRKGLPGQERASVRYLCWRF